MLLNSMHYAIMKTRTYHIVLVSKNRIELEAEISMPFYTENL